MNLPDKILISKEKESLSIDAISGDSNGLFLFDDKQKRISFFIDLLKKIFPEREYQIWIQKAKYEQKINAEPQLLPIKKIDYQKLHKLIFLKPSNLGTIVQKLYFVPENQECIPENFNDEKNSKTIYDKNGYSITFTQDHIDLIRHPVIKGNEINIIEKKIIDYLTKKQLKYIFNKKAIEYFVK